MIRRAGPQDTADLETFLRSHAATSMFLRGNLAALGTQELRHRHGTTYLIKEELGAIVAVVGCTNGGYLMCQAPDQPADFWGEIVRLFKGRRVAGMTGEPEQTAIWAGALGWKPDDFAINDIEPLFELQLRQLPPVYICADTFLRVPTAADQSMLAVWFDGYHRDTGMAPPQGDTADDLAKVFISKPDARILVVGSVPVAMTAINARALDTVQVGGVYVPPAHRGKGYGGAIVAQHLAELAQDGIQLAILFAANDIAAKAYEKIGFNHVGSYRVSLLNTPLVVGQRTDA